MSIETMTKLATVTVGSGGSSTIEFTNIPQTYTDLVIKLSGRASSPYLDIKFNNTTSNRSARYLYGNGSSAGSGTQAGFLGVISSTSNTANTFGTMEIYISNYASSNYKTYSADSAQETNATSPEMHLVAGLWSNTSAINQITILPSSGTFSEFSTATLYGIRNMRQIAGNSVKATGGNISFDGTYVVHTFNTTDVFTPTTNLVVDYLVVAGGGGGGANYGGGGGGAGGLRSTVTATGGGGSLESALSLTASTGYTVTVGAGGTGEINSPYSAATNGSNSVFSTITSTGGGYGTGGATAGNGGSGGGARAADGTSRTGGTGTANQGYAGGNNGTSGVYGAGGGGGANAVGSNGSTTVGGNGGAGVATSISGSSVTYAGGGGGGTYTGGTSGTGGSGGGGNAGASDNTSGSSGTVNTGGGGGGQRGPGNTSNAGGNGGSGVVIIRYKA